MGTGMDSEDDLKLGQGDITFLHGAARSADPLPRGQHDLSPEYVAAHQRLRIQEATTHVVAERGYGAATIGDIVARAHVSRRTFYAHFETKDHAALATFGASVQCIADAVRAPYSAQNEWDAAVAAGLTELMRVLVEYPATARLCFLEIRSVGALAVEPMQAAYAMCTEALRSAVASRPGTPAMTDIALEMGVGGLFAVTRARLASDDLPALQRELPEIAEALLAPLMGHEPAQAVIERIEAAPGVSAAHAI